MKYAFMRIQCRDMDGNIGDFIAPSSGSQERLSPLFSSLGPLYAWMEKNGWKVDEYTKDAYESQQFIPWRVSTKEQ